MFKASKISIRGNESCFSIMANIAICVSSEKKLVMILWIKSWQRKCPHVWICITKSGHFVFIYVRAHSHKWESFEIHRIFSGHARHWYRLHAQLHNANQITVAFFWFDIYTSRTILLQTEIYIVKLVKKKMKCRKKRLSKPCTWLDNNKFANHYNYILFCVFCCLWLDV